MRGEGRQRSGMDPMSWCRVSLIGTPYSRANGFARGASERRGVNAALENGPTDYKGSGHVTRFWSAIME